MKRIDTKEVKELTKRKKKKLPIIMKGYGLPTRIDFLHKVTTKLKKIEEFDLKENWVYYNESDKETIEKAIKDIKSEVKNVSN